MVNTVIYFYSSEVFCIRVPHERLQSVMVRHGWMGGIYGYLYYRYFMIFMVSLQLAAEVL